MVVYRLLVQSYLRRIRHRAVFFATNCRRGSAHSHESDITMFTRPPTVQTWVDSIPSISGDVYETEMNEPADEYDYDDYMPTDVSVSSRVC